MAGPFSDGRMWCEGARCAVPPNGRRFSTGRRLRRVLPVAILIGVTACTGSETSSTPTTNAPATTATSTPTTPTAQAPSVTDSAADACVDSLVSGLSAVPCRGVVYDLALPEECWSEPCGLIIDFHPSGLTGDETDAYTNMRALGNEAGYAVVQPNSSAGQESAAQDRVFVDALIAALDIDVSRVHVGGASLGGFQTWHFVCDHADLIASAAPHAAGAGYTDKSCDFDEYRSPAQQVDIFMLHGRNDSSVPFRLGTAQLQKVIDHWEMTQNEVLVDDPDFTWTRWTNDEGTVLEFVEFDWTTPSGSGHCYPGGVGSGGCGADTPIHYGEAALAFYIDHPKSA